MMARTRTTTQYLLERNAAAAPDKVFVTFPGGTWTREQTLNMARSVANGLRSLGVTPGEYVASWLPNGPEALLAMFGINLAGAVAAPMNTAYRGGLLEHALRVTGAQVLIAHKDLLPYLADVELSNVQTVVVVGEARDSVDSRVRAVTWQTLESASATPLPAECSRQAWDDMIVIFTSGTTGPSKGVRCSYLHHAAYADWFTVGDLGTDDRALILLPLFHVGGTGWVYAALTWGASIALLPRFRTATFWGDVEELGATTCTMVGAMAHFLLEQPPCPNDADNGLRIALATPWMDRWPEFGRRFGVALWAGFGMSEVPGPLRSAFPNGDITGLGQETSPEWEVLLVDENDMPVTDGEPGELLVRHRQPGTITSGYLAMPAETAAAWRNGWFHTGDVVVRRPDASYAYVDRRKDAIRRRGENISSLEVESEIRQHPAVLDVAVVAVPSANSDDEVMAFVQLRGGSSITARELAEFVIPRMPHYMVPRYIEFLDDLPRTPTGKVRKVELRHTGTSFTTWDREAEGLVLHAPRLSATTRDEQDGAAQQRTS